MPGSSPLQTDQPRTQPATRIITVCIVDPRKRDYQDWEALGAESGIRLEVVATAHEALRFSRATAVDLWVVSADLPGLSGGELCGMLKSGRSDAAVWLVANEYSLEAERAAWGSRATMFSSKPQHTEQYRAWLAHWNTKRANRLGQT